ncbi:MAG: hypothetical protein HUU57_15835 [Bdellovibrio sp.]|nr:hypothetical protein [Bdellovibrio sp.]
MKKMLFAAALVILFSGCATSTKNEEFKARAADCATMCKASPEIKEYSQSHGGGFALLFFGSEEQKCTCTR